MNLATPARPVLRVERSSRILPPAEMPSGEGEEAKVYVRTFKPGSPFFDKTIMGVTFQKYTMPPEWTLAENADRTFFPNMPTVLLTPSQAKAILDRAAIAEDKTPRIEDENGVVSPAERCFLGDHILLEDAEEYQMRQYRAQAKKMGIRTEPNEPEPKPVTGENLKEDIYKEQSRKTRGKK